MNVGPLEIMVIMVVALLVFGPHRLPEVGRQVGGALRELRKMQDTVRGELDMVLHPEHGTSSSSARSEPEDHTALPSGTDDDSGDTESVSYDGAEWSDADWADNGIADNGIADNGIADNGIADNGIADKGISENGTSDKASDDSRFLGPPDSFI